LDNGAVKASVDMVAEEIKVQGMVPCKGHYYGRRCRCQRRLQRKQSQKRKKFGEKLNGEDWKRSKFKIIKHLEKDRQDVIRVNCFRDDTGSIVVKPEMVRKRWKEYMENLLNVENLWDVMVEGWIDEGPRVSITEMKMKRSTGQMKSGKTDTSGE